MFYLFLSILSSISIANFLKFFQKDKDSFILFILLFNYLTASFLGFFQSGMKDFKIDFFDSLLAFIIGFLFFINFFIYDRNIKSNGISFSISVMRISLLVPTIVSIIFFKEKIKTSFVIGLIFIIIGFILLGNVKKFLNIFLIFLLFFISGLSDTGLKIFDVYGKTSPSLFLFFLFFSAFLVNLITIFFVKKSLNYKNILYGIIIGIPNYLMSFFFLKSLEFIPASIAYPLLGSGIVGGGILTDIFLWKKKLDSNQLIILIFLFVGMVLLNLK